MADSKVQCKPSDLHYSYTVNNYQAIFLDKKENQKYYLK